MECLKDFILSRSCANQGALPKSGLWLEMLEGISIQNVAKVDDGKYDSAKAFIQEKIDFAGQLVLEDARAMLMDEFATSETKEAAKIGVLEPELGYYDAEDLDRGIYIEKRYSPLGQIIVEKLTLLANTTIQGKTVTISDGIITKTFEVDLVAGMPYTFEVGFEGITDYLTIKWNTADIEAGASSIRKSITRGFCGYCGGSDAPLFIQGINGSTRGMSSYGIQADIQLKCDLKKAFCQMLDDLKFAILYKVGILILKEWQASTRLNFLTIHSDEWLELKLPEWEELTYPAKLKNGLVNASTYLSKMDSRCFQKNGWTYAETLG